MESTNSKKLVDELIEDKELDKEIIKTFKSKKSLSDSIFDSSLQMHSDVRNKLLKIAEQFIDYVGIDFFIHDIVLTGSLANYNWSKYSDVDLHILIDMNEFTSDNSEMEQPFKDLIKEFFMTKKSLWNHRHAIEIKNFDVEIYVEDIHEQHISSGVYSILNNKWIVKPQKTKESIDERKILEKGEEYANMIDQLLDEKDVTPDITEKIDEIKEKLRNFRKSGLEKGGEYSYENLTFKLLRRNGYIGKLVDLKKEITDKNLSIKQ